MPLDEKELRSRAIPEEAIELLLGAGVASPGEVKIGRQEIADPAARGQVGVFHFAETGPGKRTSISEALYLALVRAGCSNYYPGGFF